MSANIFKYIAFISYSRKDEAVAHRIQTTLEHYKLGSEARALGEDTPDRIRPIFRDKTDLAIGNLASALTSALCHSMHLIVVCTPNSAKPNAKGKHYVNFEIENFIKANPEDGASRVLPIICKPSDDTPDEECLPPAIIQHGITPLIMDRKRSMRSYIELISRILKIDAEVLWNDWRHQQRRRNIVRGALAACTLAALAWGGFEAYDYYAPHYSYYAHCLPTRDGVLGITPIERGAASNGAPYFKFTTQRGKVRTVTRMAEGNELADPPYGNCFAMPAITKLEYSEDGALSKRDARAAHALYHRVDAYSQAGDSASVSKWADIATPCRPSLAALARPSGFRGQTPAVREQAEYDSTDGLPVKISFKTEANNPARGWNGGYGFSISYNAARQPVCLSPLDEKGNPATPSFRCPQIAYTYGSDGTLRSTEYKDGNGMPLNCAEGYSKATYTPEDSGWRETYSSPAGTPPDIASRRYQKDSRGRIAKVSAYDANNRPAADKDGVSSRTFSYAEDGAMLSETSYDTNGAELARYAYDRQRHVISADRNGTTVRYHLNEEGQLSMEEEPAGGLVRKKVYTPDGLPEKIAYEDAQGNPAVCEQGYSIKTMDYNYAGALTEERFYDPQGKPVMNKDGYSSRLVDLDENNMVFRETFYDTNGAPCLNGDGYARKVVFRRTSGNINLEIFQNTDFKLADNADGVAYIEHKYDQQNEYLGPTKRNATHKAVEVTVGNIVEHRQYGENDASLIYYTTRDGQPCEYGGPFHKRVTKAIPQENGGLILEQTAYNLKGELVSTEDGFAIVREERDNKGHRLSVSYYDVNGQPACVSEGYHRFVHEFAEKDWDHPTELRFYDPAGNLVMTPMGYARIHWAKQPGPSTQISEWVFYNEKNEEIPAPANDRYLYNLYTR